MKGDQTFFFLTIFYGKLPLYFQVLIELSQSDEIFGSDFKLSIKHIIISVTPTLSRYSRNEI